MATTLQNIMATLQASAIVPGQQVNYGVVDGLQPPYICVTDYEYTQEYQTCRPATRESTFHVMCFAATADAAQDLGQSVMSLLDSSTTLTPQTSRVQLRSYRLGQMPVSPTLYQFVADTEWTLHESIP